MDMPVNMIHRLMSLQLAVFLGVVAADAARAADNELTDAEQAEGWILLFNGRDLTDWRNNNGKPVKATIEEGAVNPHGSGGYLLVYEKPFADFVLKCDVKMSGPNCNSGVFLRCGDLTDPVYSSLEVQVHAGGGTSVHDFGAIYDLVAPTKNEARAHEWNNVEVRCKGPTVAVTVNGEKVAEMNADEWSEPAKRPDGTAHKFGKAIKDFPRSGYVGLQDHDHDVWFKNIKLLPL